MAITINWATKVISVPQADLTFISGSLYELDVDTFRLTLKGLEDDEAGMPFVRTHNHNTQVTLGGVTLARTVEIINGYTITFQDGQYAVRLVGANNNIADVLNINQVSLRSNNSAGLLVSGSGVTAQDKTDIIVGVLDEPGASESQFNLRQTLRIIAAVIAGNINRDAAGAYTIKGVQNAAKTRIQGTVDSDGVRTVTMIDAD